MIRPRIDARAASGRAYRDWDTVLVDYARQIADFAAKNRLPSMYSLQ